MANDIRSLTNPNGSNGVNNVTPSTMGSQKLGRAVIFTGVSSGFAQTNDKLEVVSGQNGPQADSDPNNVVAKYDSRFDHITYY